ncbi:MAG: GntR family transcriptional regulator [Pseudonocardiaceae bacterium]
MTMRIAINRSMGIPLVTQIRDQIVAAIAGGHLERGDRLPTIRQLAEFLGINRNTVAQVYRQLENEGYLSTRAGGGTTVAHTVATTDTIRASTLRELVSQALRAAEAAGFTPREFAELAYYQSAQQYAHPSILVIDEYGGELDFLDKTIRAALPASTIQCMLLADLAAVPAQDRPLRLHRFDFALVPFYCLEQVTTLLAGCDLPTLAAGVGPSLKVLERIRDTSADKSVAIVCSEPSGPEYMERSLRRAGIAFLEVHHAYLGQDKLADILAESDLIIASEGSTETVRALAAEDKVITYSAILSAESLATVRSYAGYVSRQHGSDGLK